MTVRNRIVLVALWIASLVVMAQWSGRAQSGPQIGHEVRFIRGQSHGSGHTGILVANFNGQWLPVTLDTMPDGNGLGHR